MKDKNGIEINCENCKHCKDCDDKLFPDYCDDKFFPGIAKGCDNCNFEVSNKAYEARIAALQKKLHVVQASERAEAQEVDRLNEDDAEEAWNKRYEQFSLSEMELLRDIVDAKLKSVKRDSEYRCSLLRLSIKCIDILRKLKNLKEVED